MRMVTFGSLLVAATYVLNAQAGQQTTTMTVSAELVDTCSINADNINFGSGTTPELVGASKNSQIIVSCPENTDWTVALEGDWQSGRMLTYVYPPQEPMYFEALGYEYVVKHISTSNPAGELWGNGSAKLGDPVSGLGEQVLTAQASIIGVLDESLRILGLQGNPAGSYTDTITITLDY